jgi:drug/metabolite transporter (DMT)-like permease
MIFLAFAVVIWGFSFALSKMALATLTPFELVTVRLLLGAATGWVVTKVMRMQIQESGPKRWTGLETILVGLFEFGGMYLLYTWSLKYLPSGVVGALTLLTPVFTYLVSVAMRVDRFTPKTTWSVVLAVVGAALCLPLHKIFSNFELANKELVGCLLITASNLSFAVGNVFISRFQIDRRWNPRITYRAQTLGAVVALVPALLYPHSDYSQLTVDTNWLLPVYLGVVATGVGFFLWNEGVKRVSATPASVIGNFKAPLSLLWGWVLLKEEISLQLIAGVALLLAAGSLLKKSQKPS